MAVRWAVANGNWSATATWNGGTLPGVDDDVHADGRAVTINQNITVKSLRTTQRSGGTAGGSFTANVAGRTVNADTIAGTTVCLNLSNGAVQNGDAYGGPGSLIYGSSLTAGSIINGNSYGSTSTNGYGLSLNTGSIQNGNTFGGSGLNAAGNLAQNGSIHNGDSFGGSASGAHGSRLATGSIQNGNSTGGSASGAHGTSVESGSMHFGSCIGGSVVGAFGSSVVGGVLIVTSVTDATGEPTSLGNDATVILQNGVVVGDVNITGLRVMVGNLNHPFINPVGGGAIMPPIGSGGLVY